MALILQSVPRTLPSPVPSPVLVMVLGTILTLCMSPMWSVRESLTALTFVQVLIKMLLGFSLTVPVVRLQSALARVGPSRRNEWVSRRKLSFTNDLATHLRLVRRTARLF